MWFMAPWLPQQMQAMVSTRTSTRTMTTTTRLRNNSDDSDAEEEVRAEFWSFFFQNHCRYMWTPIMRYKKSAGSGTRQHDKMILWMDCCVTTIGSALGGYSFPVLMCFLCPCFRINNVHCKLYIYIHMYIYMYIYVCIYRHVNIAMLLFKNKSDDIIIIQCSPQ